MNILNISIAFSIILYLNFMQINMFVNNGLLYLFVCLGQILQTVSLDEMLIIYFILNIGVPKDNKNII